jgi:Na+-translocating ferredoxin:NAD+ oxidoreductase subunit D
MSTDIITEEPKKLKFELTTSPHLHSAWSTQKVMWYVVASLLPTVAAAVIFFGTGQLLVIAVSILFANLTEAAVQYFRHKKITLYDGSAVITGLLLALTLPPNFSLISTAIGAVVAIGLGKQIFGGLGYNIFNPALVGRAFLQAAFPVAMTTWSIPNYAVDAVSKATPLSAFKFDRITAAAEPLFLGNIGGSLGETSALAIIAAGVFLMAVKIVNWRIPAAMVIGVLLFGGLFNIIDPVNYPPAYFHLLSGGFLFAAVFMATDWVTSPVTRKGMWIFGLGIAFLVVIIRIYGGLPEGVMYSILLMNALVPILNRYTKPVIFGVSK